MVMSIRVLVFMIAIHLYNYPFFFLKMSIFFVIEKCKYHDIFNTEDESDASVDEEVLGM